MIESKMWGMQRGSRAILPALVSGAEGEEEEGGNDDDEEDDKEEANIEGDDNDVDDEDDEGNEDDTDSARDAAVTVDSVMITFEMYWNSV